MRCLSCNEELTEFESTRKSVVTNEYIDLCNRCYATIANDVDAIERADLEHDSDVLYKDDMVDEDDYELDKYE